MEEEERKDYDPRQRPKNPAEAIKRSEYKELTTFQSLRTNKRGKKPPTDESEPA